MSLLKLNVGSGNQPFPGYVNCDYYASPNVDKVFDVQKPWPFDDNSVGQVWSHHMLEHLTDYRAFFREAHRVMAPGANMTLRLPYGASNEAFEDWDHLTYWFPGRFACLQPGYAKAVGNMQGDGWEAFYRVDFVGCMVNRHLTWLARFPWRFLGGLTALWYLWGGHTELVVSLTALKTPEQIAEFHAQRGGGTIPINQAVHLQFWNPKQWAKEGKPEKIIRLSSLFLIRGFGEEIKGE